ncbi:MAG: hypothetical protein ACP5N7_00540 [Candidatus Pacearchaeota archaeon]
MKQFNFKFNKSAEKQPLLFEEINNEVKKSHRRKTEINIRTTKHIYKRAHSELQLLNCLNDEKLKVGHTYDFITSGDVDSLSFFNLVNRTFPKIEHLMFSTWCMAAEDIIYLFDLVENGTIKKLDSYLGEIFPGTYKIEYKLLQELYEKYNCGKIVVFKNHSKIFAGISECGQGFSIQSSANINTNPRTENASINIDTESYHFYNDYFNGINSFEK